METSGLGHFFNLRAWFKSYYVVWKHNVRSDDFEKSIQFKSYYVVWKPLNGSLNHFQAEGLNRTM